MLLKVAEPPTSSSQTQSVAPGHACVLDEPQQQQQQQPGSANLQMYLQGIVADLRSLAVTASEQIQQKYTELSSSSAACFALKTLQQQVLQVCQTLVQDLAIRLAHTVHLYFDSVLNHRWRAGWALHDVFEKQGVQQQLEERLAVAASAIVSRGQVNAEVC